MFEAIQEPVKRIEFLFSKFFDHPEDYQYEYLDDLLAGLIVTSYLRLAFHLIYEPPAHSEAHEWHQRFAIAWEYIARIFDLFPAKMAESPYLHEILNLAKSTLDVKLDRKVMSSSFKRHLLFDKTDEWFDSFVGGRSSCAFIIWKCKNDENLRLALQKPRWEDELKRYEQMHEDLNSSEDFTDDEVEAYERVMKKLGR
jgi:hypothetical protein